MTKRTISILKAVGNPNKARIIAHLAKHRGETPENLGKHLGYPLPTVYKYLRELEATRMVECEVKNRVRLYYPNEFEFMISPEKLMEAFEEQNITDIYEDRFGDHGMERLNKMVDKVKAGNMTYRQAASTLGITYYEFVLLMNEIGAADE